MKYSFPDGFRLGATGAGWQMEGEADKRPDQKHFCLLYTSDAADE